MALPAPIWYAQGPMTRPFAPAWLSDDPAALALLPRRAHVAAERALAVAAAARKSLDPRLLAVLRRQNAQWPASAARDHHLTLLGQPGTVVVVTGQQAGLFLGPLYTLYKAASAIVAARQVTVETGVACVPLFWLQTEDHDFAEIDHAFVPRTGQEPQKIALDPTPASRVPVAHRVLGDDVAVAVDTLRASLHGLPHADEALALLTPSWRPGQTITQAFAQTLAALLADQGLVLLDPRDPELAPLAAPLHRQCVLEAGPIAAALQAQVDALHAAGFAPQVHIRPGAPLCFVSPDAVDGPRYRLDPTDHADVWQLVGHPEHATVTTATLLHWLDTAPLRLTTSALSRPLLQDLWLPTVGYVGGPGEVAYFAQLAPLYRHLHLTMPLVLHRARFAVLDGKTRALLDAQDVSLADLAGPRDALLRRLADRPHDGAFAPPAEVAAQLSLTPAFAALTQAMTQLDPSLAKAVARTQETVTDAVHKLVDKYARALAQRDQQAIDRLDRARQWLFPGGAPQERVLALAGVAARFGQARVVDAVLAACVPFSGALQELTLHDQAATERAG